jgi:hypothetical protein
MAGRSQSVPGSLGTGTPPVVSLKMVSYCMEYRSPRTQWETAGSKITTKSGLD